MKKPKSAATRPRPKEGSKGGDPRLAVLKSFRIIYGAVRQHFRQVRRTCGISGSQLWILHELLRTNGIGVSELATKLGIHQSTCSQHVEKLVRAGYLKKMRLSDDQRRVELIVTAKGQRCAATARTTAVGCSSRSTPRTTFRSPPRTLCASARFSATWCRMPLSTEHRNACLKCG